MKLKVKGIVNQGVIKFKKGNSDYIKLPKKMRLELDAYKKILKSYSSFDTGYERKIPVILFHDIICIPTSPGSLNRLCRMIGLKEGTINMKIERKPSEKHFKSFEDDNVKVKNYSEVAAKVGDVISEDESKWFKTSDFSNIQYKEDSELTQALSVVKRIKYIGDINYQDINNGCYFIYGGSLYYKEGHTNYSTSKEVFGNRKFSDVLRADNKSIFKFSEPLRTYMLSDDLDVPVE